MSDVALTGYIGVWGRLTHRPRIARLLPGFTHLGYTYHPDPEQSLAASITARASAERPDGTYGYLQPHISTTSGSSNSFAPGILTINPNGSVSGAHNNDVGPGGVIYYPVISPVSTVFPQGDQTGYPVTDSLNAPSANRFVDLQLVNYRGYTIGGASAGVSTSYQLVDGARYPLPPGLTWIPQGNTVPLRATIGVYNNNAHTLRITGYGEVPGVYPVPIRATSFNASGNPILSSVFTIIFTIYDTVSSGPPRPSNLPHTITINRTSVTDPLPPIYYQVLTRPYQDPASTRFYFTHNVDQFPMGQAFTNGGLGSLWDISSYTVGATTGQISGTTGGLQVYVWVRGSYPGASGNMPWVWESRGTDDFFYTTPGGGGGSGYRTSLKFDIRNPLPRIVPADSEPDVLIQRVNPTREHTTVLEGTTGNLLNYMFVGTESTIGSSGSETYSVIPVSPLPGSGGYASWTTVGSVKYGFIFTAPTEPGTYSYILRVTNSAGSTEVPLIMVVRVGLKSQLTGSAVSSAKLSSTVSAKGIPLIASAQAGGTVSRFVDCKCLVQASALTSGNIIDSSTPISAAGVASTACSGNVLAQYNLSPAPLTATCSRLVFIGDSTVAARSFVSASTTSASGINVFRAIKGNIACSASASGTIVESGSSVLASISNSASAVVVISKAPFNLKIVSPLAVSLISYSDLRSDGFLRISASSSSQTVSAPVLRVEPRLQASAVGTVTGTLTDINYPITTGNTLLIPMLQSVFEEFQPADKTDIRRLLFSICEGFYRSFHDKSASERPQRMLITRSSADVRGFLERSYEFTFIVDSSGEEILPES